MKVSDLIKQLQAVPEDLEVWIYDSYEGVDYHGAFKVAAEDGVSGEKICVVQIGRTMVD